MNELFYNDDKYILYKIVLKMFYSKIQVILASDQHDV